MAILMVGCSTTPPNATMSERLLTIPKTPINESVKIEHKIKPTPKPTPKPKLKKIVVKKIKEAIKEDEITVYGAEWCNPCKTLKKYLNEKSIPYKYIDIDKNNIPLNIKEYIDKNGIPTVVKNGIIGNQSLIK